MAETKPKVLVLIYSMYGHIKQLAEQEKLGLEEAGCEVDIRRAPELLSDEILAKMHASPDLTIPVIDVKDLPSYDGILFGLCTRFGMAAAQMKAVMDATGGLWQTGALVGKPAGIFVSTATQGGGQETTALTFLTQLTHHGMIFVPIGYSTPLSFNMDEIHGGSAYGAGTFAGGDGSRQPSELEKGIAKHQGSYFANVAKALKAGKAKLAAAAPATTTTAATTSGSAASAAPPATAEVPKPAAKIEEAKKLDDTTATTTGTSDKPAAAATTGAESVPVANAPKGVLGSCSCIVA